MSTLAKLIKEEQCNWKVCDDSKVQAGKPNIYVFCAFGGEEPANNWPIRNKFILGKWM